MFSIMFLCCFKYGAQNCSVCLIGHRNNSKPHLLAQAFPTSSSTMFWLYLRITFPALGVKRKRTTLELNFGSEPALKLPWWKKGYIHIHMKGTDQQHQRYVCFIQRQHLLFTSWSQTTCKSLDRSEYGQKQCLKRYDLKLD